MYIYAKEYKIGTQNITITQPQGWVDISSINPEWVVLSQKLMPSDLRLLTGSWERSDVELFLLNKAPLLQRYFLFSTYKGTENISFTKSKFKQLKESFKNKFDSMPSRIADKIKAAEKQASDILSDSNHTIKVSNKSIVPLGIDYDDENALSASLISTTSVTENGKEKILMQACVMSIILVKDKILIIYGYTPFREQKDLKWCQEQSLIIIQSILNENLQKTPFNVGIIPEGSEIAPLTQRLLQEPQKTYSSAGNPKAKGIDFSLDIPASWSNKSSKRPNVAFNFVAPNYKMILPSCIVVVKNFPGLTQGIISTLSEEEATNPSFLKSLFGSNFQYKRGGLTKIDGESTIWAEGYQVLERSNVKIRAYLLCYIIFYKENGIIITFGCGSPVEDEELKEIYDAYLPLFQKITSSIVIQSKLD